ncbi:MAG TPA: T9SS type A sorting domain-containing protein, partial [Ignavibacteria bacterium]|nr:T9SS type A sorting domain-containing protein [Ignavibacteria bacterium]
QKRKQRDYAGAINKCKELINEHDTSSYFNSAMSELYLNYLESDTSGNQTITNGLFNNLKTYIEQKMQQYPNNTQFVERAYKYHLMCLVKTKSYTEAIAGYENIMNNHPDPIVRLNASWDRSAVVFMMGQGGSENDNSIKSSKSRNTKLLNKNPAHRIAKDIFREQKVQSEQIEKNITDEQLNNEDISTVVYTKEEKQMLERRIENYNPTDKKDFMEKLSKDIKLIEQINTAKNTKKTNSNVPRSFKLHQNYPNPFNPTTTIKYEIPKDAEITIKVYDLLGREVFSINEYKKAGSYEVKFDGANLASGMYLYSLEVSDPSTGSGRGYMDTKKMVLLK